MAWHCQNAACEQTIGVVFCILQCLTAFGVGSEQADLLLVQ